MVGHSSDIKFLENGCGITVFQLILLARVSDGGLARATKAVMKGTDPSGDARRERKMSGNLLIWH